MINISAATNNVINNNFSTESNNSKVSDNKNTFLNLLTSHNANKNLSYSENNNDNEISGLNVNDEKSENSINNIFQNDIILLFNNYYQSKIMTENFNDSNLIKEEVINKTNENKAVELKIPVNLTLLNNESANSINNFQNNKLPNRVNLESFKINEFFSEKNNLNLNDNKVLHTKVHEKNNVVNYNEKNDVSNISNSIIPMNSLYLNNSEFKNMNVSDLNKLLNNFNVQNPKVQKVIEKSNFYTANSNNLKNIINSDIINNDFSKNIIINNSDDNSNLENIFLKNNLFESKQNTSQNADNLSELNFESKKLENSNLPQNHLSADVNTFNKIIEITDDSNLLKSGVTTQIKDTINLMYNEKTSQVTMKLNPENLGKIDIKLLYNNDCIKVEITSFNDETNKILNSSVNELISALKNNTEKPVEVIIKSDNNFSDKQFNFNQSSESNYQNEKQRKNKYIHHHNFVEDEEKNGVFKNLIYL